MSGASVGNKIVVHSDVVGASPVGAAPTTSSFSTLTPGFSGLGKYDCKTRRETFKCWDLVRLYQRLDGIRVYLKRKVFYGIVWYGTMIDILVYERTQWTCHMYAQQRGASMVFNVKKYNSCESKVYS